MSHHDANAHGTQEAHGHGEAHAVHIVPLKVYLAVYAALVALTIVTVAVSYVDIGFLNVPVAMAIATLKVSLVALIFMHLLYDDKFNAIVFVMGLLFLGVFIVMTLVDPMTRGKVYRAEYGPINPPPLVRDVELAKRELAEHGLNPKAAEDLQSDAAAAPMEAKLTPSVPGSEANDPATTATQEVATPAPSTPETGAAAPEHAAPAPEHATPAPEHATPAPAAH